MNLYAVSNDKALRANGESARFKVGGSVVAGNDSIGPSVFCYLNSPTFADGGNVKCHPLFRGKDIRQGRNRMPQEADSAMT